MRLFEKSVCLAGLLTACLPALLIAGPINVNTADAEAISAELKGVGISKAQAIVDYRSRNGAFEAPEELLKVKGIGPKVLRDNAGNILLAE